MDNCSQNGAKLRESVLTMTKEWQKAEFVEEGFVNYVSDEKVVAFPWTMIDKITPRPSEQIAEDLENLGVVILIPLAFGLAKKTKKSTLYYVIPLLAGLATGFAFIPPSAGSVLVANWSVCGHHCNL